MIEFIIPSLGQKKDRIVAPPLPKDKGMSQSGKYLFYCSVPVTNMRHQGEVAAFRNHICRTDSEVLAEFIRKDFIETPRKTVPFTVEEITEEEYQARMSGNAEAARPKDPMEGVIIPIPNQGPDPGVKTSELSTGMSNSLQMPTLSIADLNLK